MDLSHWIERHACFAPHAPALRFEGRSTGYGDLAREIDRASAVLAALGVRGGEVVAFLGLNNPLAIVLLFACARLGALFAPMNWRLAVPEHARTLAHCRPRVLVAEAAFAGQIGDRDVVPEGTVRVVCGAERAGWAAWDALDASAGTVPRAGGDDSPVLLCYTSGSTAAPKGVVHTQRSLLWNAINSTHMHDLSSADRVLTTLPLFHVGGLNILTMPALHAGACVTLHPKFDPLAAFEAIERERITLTVLVPAQLAAMMESARWADSDLSSLRAITTGSTIVSGAFVRRVCARGVPLIQVYGSTETCPIATYVRAADARRKAGSAGSPALHCEVRVVDESGRELASGTDGEIVVRGPNLMLGYWNAPHDTEAALRDGWFRSGDVGHFDGEGHLYVVSRLKDLIISGGENIYPAELESILLECPDVEDACVVGRPDERWGEAVVAAVVLRAGSRLGEGDVMALFDGRLARYKHPREVRLMRELPRTALGKLKKEEVRAAMRAAAPGRGGGVR